MAIQRLTVVNAEVANNDRPKAKHKVLADRLREKVSRFDNENDKMKYLGAVAHMS